MTVLKKVELKDLYSHEIKFKGKVGDTDYIYRILSLPGERNEHRRNNFSNTVFVTMFFPTSVSDTAVKKAFLEFGEVHDVFDNKFKKYIAISVMANAILALLPIKSSMTIPMKYSLMTLSFFRSCVLRKKYNAKSVCEHMLILATQHQITFQIRTVSLMMRVLHWLL